MDDEGENGKPLEKDDSISALGKLILASGVCHCTQSSDPSLNLTFTESLYFRGVDTV
jgi:hypothetical protein